MNLKIKIDKVFSFFLAFYPVLCLYKAFSDFTIGGKQLHNPRYVATNLCPTHIL